MNLYRNNLMSHITSNRFTDVKVNLPSSERALNIIERVIY